MVTSSAELTRVQVALGAARRVGLQVPRRRGSHELKDDSPARRANELTDPQLGAVCQRHGHLIAHAAVRRGQLSVRSCSSRAAWTIPIALGPTPCSLASVPRETPASSRRDVYPAASSARVAGAPTFGSWSSAITQAGYSGPVAAADHGRKTQAGSASRTHPSARRGGSAHRRGRTRPSSHDPTAALAAFLEVSRPLVIPDLVVAVQAQSASPTLGHSSECVRRVPTSRTNQDPRSAVQIPGLRAFGDAPGWRRKGRGRRGPRRDGSRTHRLVDTRRWAAGPPVTRSTVVRHAPLGRSPHRGRPKTRPLPPRLSQARRLLWGAQRTPTIAIA